VKAADRAGVGNREEAIKHIGTSMCLSFFGMIIGGAAIVTIAIVVTNKYNNHGDNSNNNYNS